MTNDNTAYLSCAAVARRLGLSRQRFWMLRKEGVFPEPQYDKDKRRKYYTEEQLELCMDLRRRNVGLNGQVVLFYSARTTTAATKQKARKANRDKKSSSKHAAIIESLKALGLTAVTDTQIDKAIKTIFPGGFGDVDQAELIRAIFLHIQRQNSQ